MNKTWPEVFIEFFCNNKSEIGEVLYAAGCREGWLQGEMFRLSDDQDFSVNTYSLGNGSHKTDLYGKRPFVNSDVQEMVAEIKIISPSSYKKNIDGTDDISIYTEGEVVNVSDTNTYRNKVKDTEGSLLKDYFRLKDIQDSGIEKYLILVIPHYEESAVKEELNKALYTITFDGHQPWQWHFPEDHFNLRIWKID